MATPLIPRIFNEGPIHLPNPPTLILQTNIQTELLTYTLITLNYQIIQQLILQHKPHIYQILLPPHIPHHHHLHKKQLRFPPKLLQNKNQIFYKKCP
ncbi:tRNA (adenine(22)-N(1))-methyltransferase TrmK, partial [Staphylococcus haemolyticus]|uniref:tRNA (adenine(22)-N(1))-methyltransferase TrmK n=1 Tax=Staphylococcus haemolyticus TaxID=1283 RepID=UPI001642572A